ncbi:MAG: DCC1-like thiol-disulfide oxidoreductase family protein [Erythrobacter sp.]|uniref:thiol-disulfide oxidoreductase DCC family protein n=1 Tax=Erythrobacter sp. TaxID=1042 RepID=UPI0026027D3E|nr:DCC1-like thiol-disulfide oxidoreductase family protein [Erythrobacter sp.]MDJ0977906.1 DCC1-like thiol-disulfide oxidoreductase family protein [Erythrobacter sp.]
MLNHTQAALNAFQPYSYRGDPAVPEFDDSRSLFIFDHHCVLCSGGVGFIMKRDKRGAIAFTSAQKTLGAALCRHYGIDWDESFLFLHKGRPYIKFDGYFAVARAMGGLWRIPTVFRIVPRALLDRVYDLVARNRYKWFGQTQEACAVLTPDQRARLM